MSHSLNSLRILVSLAALCAGFRIHAAEVRLAASSTTISALIQPQQAAVEKLTGFTLKVTSSSTGRGLVDLAQGRCDAALVSEPFEIALGAANLAGERLERDAYAFHSVAVDHIAFVVHPSNPVELLTNEQLRGIHTGQITNWKQVGGPDLRIVVFTNTVTGGTPALVKAAVLRGDDYSPLCKQVDSIGLVATQVAETPGAIGATNANFADARIVKTVRAPVLRRPLGFVTKREPSAEVECMIAAFRLNTARIGTR